LTLKSNRGLLEVKRDSWSRGGDLGRRGLQHAGLWSWWKLRKQSRV